MISFEDLYGEACKRKGGEDTLQTLISESPANPNLSNTPSDRILAHMTKGIFQAGFVWKIIEQKWPGFEETFLGFDLKKLQKLAPADWLGFQENKAIVRNGQKILAVEHNLHFILDTEAERGIPFAQFIADWPNSELTELWTLFKQKGSRLGGMTGQYLLRRLGKDCYILSRDVVTSLQRLGLEISDNPTAKKDKILIQNTFNKLHDTTPYTYTQLSKLLAYSSGTY